MKKPTRKQAKLVRELAKDPTATLEELGKRAGYKGRTQAWRALRSEPVQSELAAVRGMMDADKRTQLGALLEVLADGLAATEIRSLKVVGSKFAVEAEVKDHNARYKFLDKALELRGLVKSKDEGGAGGPVNIAIILAGGGSELEKQALADALTAARLSRGLHPLENRPLTEAEAEQYRRSP